MIKKDWYKLTFRIKSDLEEIIIWKFNDLGIYSFSFEYLANNKDQLKVDIWLPTLVWDESLRQNLEVEICKLLKIKYSNNKFFHWSTIEEENWLTTWKKYWGPELVGDNLLILPCWIDLGGKYNNKKIIKLDPGAAFGTGSHPSTNLCLEKMENIFFSGKSVLDIGSGSGILGVTARSLGAKNIFAIDNDYLAINSTKSNYLLNFGNLDNLKTHLGSFNEDITRYLFHKFDFVLCNILAEVIKEFIPDISNCLKKNGEVILSGILNSQKDEIIKILNFNNLKLIDISLKKDWVCIAARKGTG